MSLDLSKARTIDEALAYLKAQGLDIDRETAKQMLADARAAAKSLAQMMALTIAETTLAVKAAAEVSGLATTWGDALLEAYKGYPATQSFSMSARTAYAAGRWERTQAIKKTQPYLVYRTMRDGRVRGTHAELDGVALPADDPFWDTHYPPNDYGCRCIAYSADEQGIADLVKAGVPVQRTAPKEEMLEWNNAETGETVTLPASVKPGFERAAQDMAGTFRGLLADKKAALKAA